MTFTNRFLLVESIVLCFFACQMSQSRRQKTVGLLVTRPVRQSISFDEEILSSRHCKCSPLPSVELHPPPPPPPPSVGDSGAGVEEIGDGVDMLPHKMLLTHVASCWEQKSLATTLESSDSENELLHFHAGIRAVSPSQQVAHLLKQSP